MSLNEDEGFLFTNFLFNVAARTHGFTPSFVSSRQLLVNQALDPFLFRKLAVLQMAPERNSGKQSFMVSDPMFFFLSKSSELIVCSAYLEVDEVPQAVGLGQRKGHAKDKAAHQFLIDKGYYIP